jgi:hypothetical protein
MGGGGGGGGGKKKKKRTNKKKEKKKKTPPVPVLEKDVDGSRSEPHLIENAEARFGQVQACRKLTRTIFLGSAPHAVSLHASKTSRGIEYKRILLGSVMPDQVIGLFSDAMNRLVDKLHYLSNADKKQFWFDTRLTSERDGGSQASFQ